MDFRLWGLHAVRLLWTYVNISVIDSTEWPGDCTLSMYVMCLFAAGHCLTPMLMSCGVACSWDEMHNGQQPDGSSSCTA